MLTKGAASLLLILFPVLIDALVFCNCTKITSEKSIRTDLESSRTEGVVENTGTRSASSN